MIGWEKELLTKTGLIMKKEATKGSMSGRKANGAQRIDKKPEEKGATPKEQRDGTGSGIR